VTNYSFIDALFRKRKEVGKFINLASKLVPELESVYPTYRMHVLKGEISLEDSDLLEKLSWKLKEIRDKNPEAVIFCPLGLGNHVDHIIVRDVVRNVFGNVIYWEDFPYNQREKYCYNNFINGYEIGNFRLDEKNKLALINKYRTQLSGVFGISGPKLVDEKYFFKYGAYE
jgi:hypothetical protein